MNDKWRFKELLLRPLQSVCLGSLLDPRMPSLSSGLPLVMPPKALSTMKADILSFFTPSTSTSVLANTVMMSAIPPLEIQIWKRGFRKVYTVYTVVRRIISWCLGQNDWEDENCWNQSSTDWEGHSHQSSLVKVRPLVVFVLATDRLNLLLLTSNSIIGRIFTEIDSPVVSPLPPLLSNPFVVFHVDNEANI